MAPKVTFNVVGYVDRRTVDLHLRYDSIIWRRWKLKVAENEARRAIRGQAPSEQNIVRRLREARETRAYCGRRYPAPGSTFTLVSVRDLHDRGPASVGLE